MITATPVVSVCIPPYNVFDLQTTNMRCEGTNGGDERVLLGRCVFIAIYSIGQPLVQDLYSWAVPMLIFVAVAMRQTC